MPPHRDGSTDDPRDPGAGSGGGALRWDGWGDPARAVILPPAVTDLLTQVLGLAPPAAPPIRLCEVRLPPPALPPAALDAIVAALGGPQWVRSDHETRVRHSRGRSTADLLALRAGELAQAPDAVGYPGSHDEVLAVLRACAAHRIAVVPFGGGTSVVGGLVPDAAGFAAVIALDLHRLDRLVRLDAESGTAILQAGLRGPQAEALLAAHGYTLGHFPQSFEYASIGGFAATRSSGQASAGYGRFDDLVVALRAATPQGSLDLGRAPASAAGPDLRQLLLGSEGVFGVITEVTVRVRPRPQTEAYEGWRFDSFSGGMAAVRTLAQAGPSPALAVLRLSDEAETAVGLAQPTHLAGPATNDHATGDPNPDDPEACATVPGGTVRSDPAPGGTTPGGGCLLVVGYAGSAAAVAAEQDRLAGLLSAAGAQPLGAAAGTAWERGRFHGPYLRDALLDAGALVETLETAAFWSGLPALYQAVRGALTAALDADGATGLVLCHVSHVYPTGASLYFTVAAAQGATPAARWHQAKAAACEAIVSAGGTITHHHAVGTDHRRWLTAEVGGLGVEILRAVKARLDPVGVLNPGVLLPEAAGPG